MNEKLATTPPLIEYRKAYGDQIKTQLKEDKAVKQLMTLRKGHINNVWSREQIGGVDLVWGDPVYMGLSHILKRRTRDQDGGSYNQEDILQRLNEVMKQGVIYQDKKEPDTVLYL